MKKMTDVLEIIQDATLTYAQKVLQLARLAENSDTTSLPKSEEYQKALDEGVLCDLGEGAVPYRPRYIAPDYQKLLDEGSKTLELAPAKTLDDAVTSLLIMYHHVPSITSFPVYLGNLDTLLEPFVLKEEYDYAKKVIKNFLLQIDKTQLDSFVHANIGPKESTAGKIILELTKEMQLAIPNLTLKYDEELTSDEFAKLAIDTMLHTAKPSFANHKMFTKDWGEDYVIASCYNGLLLGGGGYTLHRLRLGSMAKKADNVEDFMDNVLPYYTQLLIDAMEDRVRFIVEESTFFETNFLATEGFIDKDKFTGMFGMVGLAECVNTLLGIDNPEKGFGHNDAADDLAVEVMDKIQAMVDAHKSKYCDATDHRFKLHAQVGIDSDGRENSPGPRIPVGSEPFLNEQIMHSTKFHKYFVTGCGDIFKFDQTWEGTPDALLDIVKGAMSTDFRYFSGYNDDCDVVRVTGYLVKKSELAKLDRGEASLNNVSVFGKGARDKSQALDRRVHDESSY